MRGFGSRRPGLFFFLLPFLLFIFALGVLMLRGGEGLDRARMTRLHDGYFRMRAKEAYAVSYEDGGDIPYLFFSLDSDGGAGYAVYTDGDQVLELYMNAEDGFDARLGTPVLYGKPFVVEVRQNVMIVRSREMQDIVLFVGSPRQMKEKDRRDSVGRG